MTDFFDWFFKLLYRLQKDICLIIDFIQGLFFKLGGLENIEINGDTTDILSFFLKSEVVTVSFLGISLLGFILLFIFTGISTLKNQDVLNNRAVSKGHIFVNTFKGFIQIILVPILLFAFIYLTSTIIASMLETLTIATGSEGKVTSIGARMLICVGENAWRGGENRDIIEKMFLSGSLSYADVDVVEEFYDFSEMNLLVGVFGPLVLLIFLVKAVINIIRRIIDTVVLFIISPLVGSTYPLDDGSRFSIWRELVIGRTLGTFGTIFIANICFYILPIICSISFVSSALFNGVIQILFYLAAGISISQGDSLVARIVGGEKMGKEGLHLGKLMLYGRTAGHILNGAIGAGIGILGGRNAIQNVKRYGKSGAMLNHMKEKNNALQKAQQNGEKMERRYTLLGKTRETIINTMENGLLGSIKKHKNNHDIHNT